MSAPRRGLGRGLDALLGAPQPESASGGLREIAVGAIRPSPRQPRQTFDLVALAELEGSVRELGVLVPIIVRPIAGTDEAFELIAGERRWRAAAAARLTTIPALVRDVDDKSSLEFAIVENLQRQDLDPLEEAMGLQHLMDEYRFTQESLAERIGKSRPAVANALRLLALSDSIKTLLRAGTLSAGHARALLAIEPETRELVAGRIEREGLTVRDVERYSERRKPASSKARTARTKSADLDALESRLRYALGAPVAIVPGRTGGRLEIRFADDEDLGRIVDALLPPA